MEKGKHGGARRGAGRKPKLPGKIEASALHQAVRASTPADILDRLLAASGRGDIRAMAAVRRLYYQVEQRLLASLSPATGLPAPEAGADLFSHAPPGSAEAARP